MFFSIRCSLFFLMFCLSLLLSDFTAVVVAENASDETESLSLGSCLESALSRNLTLEQSLIKIENRLQEIREVRATAYPQLEMEANYTRLGNLSKFELAEGVKVSFVPEDNYVVRMMLTQILYAGGQVNAALRLAQHAKEAVEIERELTQEAVIMMTSVYFFNAMLMEDLVRVSQETVDLIGAHLDIVKVMKEQGLVSEYDLLRTEVELANVQPQLIETRNSRELAYARLSDFVQWPRPIRRLEGEFPRTIIEIDEQLLLAQAMENRFELKLVDASRQMAEELLLIARGDRKPTVAFFSNYDWSNDEMDLMTGDTTWNEGWNLGLQGNWKLFTGFATSAKIAKAEGEIRLAEIERKKTENALRLEVHEAVNAYQQAVELLQSQGKSIEQAQKSLEIAEVRYKQGISTQLEVTDARTALSRARSNYAIAQHSLALAGIGIEKVRGTLRKSMVSSDPTDDIDTDEQRESLTDAVFSAPRGVHSASRTTAVEKFN